MNKVKENEIILNKHEKELRAMKREEFQGANEIFEHLSSSSDEVEKQKQEIKKVFEGMRAKEKRLDSDHAKQMKNIAQIYDDVCVKAKPSYWQYEKMSFQWGL